MSDVHGVSIDTLAAIASQAAARAVEQPMSQFYHSGNDGPLVGKKIRVLYHSLNGICTYIVYLE